MTMDALLTNPSLSRSNSSRNQPSLHPAPLNPTHPHRNPSLRRLPSLSAFQDNSSRSRQIQESPASPSSEEDGSRGEQDHRKPNYLRSPVFADDGSATTSTATEYLIEGKTDRPLVGPVNQHCCGRCRGVRDAVGPARKADAKR
ncbi:uncharacterized protein A4U43_C04F23390 [Asparagus officinalis]|uniref:Uncharacterized protein n=1 Tax=Asparagus officinalis TaxID=4686 RepID=A0A5P1F3R0_ASPOF|nr:uncharacterized protein A4U43_C04F23390 [Asparagus officinalis]